MKKIILVFVIGLIGFIGLLYFTLKTKVRDISNIELYATYFNKKMVLKKGVFLAKSKDLLINDPEYVLAAFDINLTDNMQPRYILPQGTVIILNAAKAYLNGVSGLETNYVIGKLYLNELKKEVSFKYAWNEAFYVEINNEISINEKLFNPVWESTNLIAK